MVQFLYEESPERWVFIILNQICLRTQREIAKLSNTLDQSVHVRYY